MTGFPSSLQARQARDQHPARALAGHRDYRGQARRRRACSGRGPAAAAGPGRARPRGRTYAPASAASLTATRATAASSRSTPHENLRGPPCAVRGTTGRGACTGRGTAARSAPRPGAASTVGRAPPPGGRAPSSAACSFASWVSDRWHRPPCRPAIATATDAPASCSSAGTLPPGPADILLEHLRGLRPHHLAPGLPLGGQATTIRMPHATGTGQPCRP